MFPQEDEASVIEFSDGSDDNYEYERKIEITTAGEIAELRANKPVEQFEKGTCTEACKSFMKYYKGDGIALCNHYFKMEEATLFDYFHSMQLAKSETDENLSRWLQGMSSSGKIAKAAFAANYSNAYTNHLYSSEMDTLMMRIIRKSKPTKGVECHHRLSRSQLFAVH